MKSVKPGRGPSFLSGAGAVAVALFGVLWTVFAAQMGAPAIFCLFGVVFVMAALGGAIYNFINATAKKRFSTFDITEDGEEEDPLNARFGQDSPEEGGGARRASSGETNFCPSCGERVDPDDRFCRKCGRELP